MTNIKIDDLSITGSDIINVIRKNRLVQTVVREFIIDHELNDTYLETDFEEKLLKEFRKERNLEGEKEFREFVAMSHLSEELLKQMITRPHRVVKYREERWGPVAQSLYLRHKEKYDVITYRRLECTDADVMQEVFFRVKDGEESWDSLAKQLMPNNPNAAGLIGPVPVSSVEPVLLDNLRKAGQGIVIGPIRIGDKSVVAELNSVQASRFDEELRQQILGQEFDAWLEETCTKMNSKISFPA